MFAKILQRPVLALVVSILIVLLGGLAVRTRPISGNCEIGRVRTARTPRSTITIETTIARTGR